MGNSNPHPASIPAHALTNADRAHGLARKWASEAAELRRKHSDAQISCPTSLVGLIVRVKEHCALALLVATYDE